MVRHVRTPAGVARFGQPIGSAIVPDALPVGRSNIPKIDALVDDFLDEGLSDWPEEKIRDYCRIPENAHGQCQEITDQFVEFAKKRGFQAYSSDVYLEEIGYTPQGRPSGTVLDEEGNEVEGFYPEHTVAFIYLPNRAWPVAIDFTATQYGYLELPKIIDGDPPPRKEEKAAVRHVRTAAGVAKFDQPIGSVIVRDATRDASALFELFTPRWEGAQDRPVEHLFVSDLLWNSIGGNEFDKSQQPFLHPERYIDRRVAIKNPKAWPGPLLRRGQVETRIRVTPGQPPTLYDVTPLLEEENWESYPTEQYEPGSIGEGEGVGMKPLRIVPDSERPLPAVFRIMDEREYQQAKKRGYIQTDARMNLGSDEGTVASSRSTGMFYAPWGARSGPQDAQARIVKIRVDPADGWKTGTDSYIKTQKRVPFDRIIDTTPPFTKEEAETELRNAPRLMAVNPSGVTMFHEDTPQQKRILRTHKTAKKVRQTYKPGTHVQSSAAKPGDTPPVGIVQYTVPGLNAQGGVIVVMWPNGQVGRHSAISLSIVKEVKSLFSHDFTNALRDAAEMLERKIERGNEDGMRSLAIEGNSKAAYIVENWDEEDGAKEFSLDLHDGSEATSVKVVADIMGVDQITAALYVIENKDVAGELAAEAQEYLEEKVIRHVRTPEGVARFHQPIGSIITRKGVLKNIREVVGLGGTYMDHGGREYRISQGPRGYAISKITSGGPTSLARGFQSLEDALIHLDTEVGKASERQREHDRAELLATLGNIWHSSSGPGEFSVGGEYYNVEKHNDEWRIRHFDSPSDPANMGGIGSRLLTDRFATEEDALRNLNARGDALQDWERELLDMSPTRARSYISYDPDNAIWEANNGDGTYAVDPDTNNRWHIWDYQENQRVGDFATEDEALDALDKRVHDQAIDRLLENDLTYLRRNTVGMSIVDDEFVGEATGNSYRVGRDNRPGEWMYYDFNHVPQGGFASEEAALRKINDIEMQADPANAGVNDLLNTLEQVIAEQQGQFFPTGGRQHLARQGDSEEYLGRNGVLYRLVRPEPDGPWKVQLRNRDGSWHNVPHMSEDSRLQLLNNLDERAGRGHPDGIPAGLHWVSTAPTGAQSYMGDDHVLYTLTKRGGAYHFTANGVEDPTIFTTRARALNHIADTATMNAEPSQTPSNLIEMAGGGSFVGPDATMYFVNQESSGYWTIRREESSGPARLILTNSKYSTRHEALMALSRYVGRPKKVAIKKRATKKAITQAELQARVDFDSNYPYLARTGDADIFTGIDDRTYFVREDAYAGIFQYGEALETPDGATNAVLGQRALRGDALRALNDYVGERNQRDHPGVQSTHIPLMSLHYVEGGGVEDALGVRYRIAQRNGRYQPQWYLTGMRRWEDYPTLGTFETEQDAMSNLDLSVGRRFDAEDTANYPAIHRQGEQVNTAAPLTAQSYMSTQGSLYTLKHGLVDWTVEFSGGPTITVGTRADAMTLMNNHANGRDPLTGLDLGSLYTSFVGQDMNTLVDPNGHKYKLVEDADDNWDAFVNYGQPSATSIAHMSSRGAVIVATRMFNDWILNGDIPERRWPHFRYTTTGDSELTATTSADKIYRIRNRYDGKGVQVWDVLGADGNLVGTDTTFDGRNEALDWLNNHAKLEFERKALDAFAQSGADDITPRVRKRAAIKVAPRKKVPAFTRPEPDSKPVVHEVLPPGEHEYDQLYFHDLELPTNTTGSTEYTVIIDGQPNKVVLRKDVDGIEDAYVEVTPSEGDSWTGRLHLTSPGYYGPQQWKFTDDETFDFFKDESSAGALARALLNRSLLQNAGKHIESEYGSTRQSAKEYTVVIGDSDFEVTVNLDVKNGQVYYTVENPVGYGDPTYTMWDRLNDDSSPNLANLIERAEVILNWEDPIAKARENVKEGKKGKMKLPDVNSWDSYQLDDPSLDPDLITWAIGTFEGAFGKNNLRTEITFSESTVDSNGVSVTGAIYDVNGLNVGRFERSIDVSGKTLHNNYLTLNARVRGQRFAEEFYHHVEESLAQEGIETVLVGANIDVGGYAWARRGFIPEYPSLLWNTCQRKLERLIENPPAGPWTPEQLKQMQAMVTRLRDNDTTLTAYEVASFGSDWGYTWQDETDQGTPYTAHVGKKLLIGTSWDGTKPILAGYGTKSIEPIEDYLKRLDEYIDYWEEHVFTPMPNSGDYNIMGADLDLPYLNETEIEEKRVAYVRTAAGAERYHKPIGSLITRSSRRGSLVEMLSQLKLPKFPEYGRKELTDPDTTRTRAVSSEEFQRLSLLGGRRLRDLRGESSQPKGLDDHWKAIADGAWEAVQDEFGGATIDSHSGVPLRAEKGYAMTVKTPGQQTVTVPIGSSRREFEAGMRLARKRFDRELSYQGHYLGVFRNDDINAIEFDPVIVVDSLDDVETIGAYTHAVGGAYNYEDGLGYWPPYVDDTVGEEAA